MKKQKLDNGEAKITHNYDPGASNSYYEHCQRRPEVKEAASLAASLYRHDLIRCIEKKWPEPTIEITRHCQFRNVIRNIKPTKSDLQGYPIHRLRKLTASAALQYPEWKEHLQTQTLDRKKSSLQCKELAWHETSKYALAQCRVNLEHLLPIVTRAIHLKLCVFAQVTHRKIIDMKITDEVHKTMPVMLVDGVQGTVALSEIAETRTRWISDKKEQIHSLAYVTIQHQDTDRDMNIHQGERHHLYLSEGCNAREFSGSTYKHNIKPRLTHILTKDIVDAVENYDNVVAGMPVCYPLDVVKIIARF